MASIQKDKNTGKWFCRVSYKDENNKYRTKTKKGFSTKKEASVYASKLELQADNGFQTEKDAILLADYYDEWVETYKVGQVSASTEFKYLHTGKLIREFFKRKKLIDLTRKDYQSFLNERGKGNGKDVVEKTHYYLKSCLQLALADGLINSDPTFNAVIRYDNEYDEKVKAWSEKDAKKLNQFLLDNMDMKNLMLYIALNTGLRIGEVYGLNYSDFRKDTLYVNRGYDYVREMTFTPGKNKSSLRAIVITRKQYDLMMSYKVKMQGNGSQYPFLDEHNHPLISHNGLLKHLYKLCDQLEIQRLPMHSLRHTHCSYLLYRKMDIHYISKRMGHSSTIETIKTYSHIIDELKQQQDSMITSLLTSFEN
jgi:integrase